MMRAIRAIIFALLFAGSLRMARADGVYRVIVHASNPTGAVDRKFLADAFLKKIMRWPSGATIRPVDQSEDSEVRRRFTEDILSRSVEAVRSYWQQLIFSGRELPPPELDSDEEVRQYVQKYAGAVGYVSASADTSGVRVIRVR